MESHMFEHLHKLIDGLINHGAEPGSPALKQVKQYLSTLEVASTVLDNSEVMAPPAKRQRTNSLQDSNGNLVTRAHLSEAWGPFPFVMPHMVPTLLRRTFGHQFAFNDADLPEFLETLQTTKGLKSLTINVETTKSGVATTMDLLRRVGPDLEIIRKQIIARLRLPRGFGSPIPELLMCYSLAMLGCMPIGYLSRTALTSMFQTVTRNGPGSLRVVSSSGTNQMSTLDPSDMVRNWLCDLCWYIMEGGSVNSILGEAVTCHDVYIGECFAKGNIRTNLDPTGEAAKKMLDKDKHNSRVLLGICQSDFVILLKYLLKYLLDLMEGEDEDLLVHLRNVSLQLP
ncbi:hypothetical protein GGI19_002527 [Coemansia pectinata]|uniref:Uncharacterized protein n=1 Tax=Coemansia pectinata TaxID=1052879 RepID=A0A9W8GVN8_9FUNG|nr:hypothetical protein GGI19_002527 [Coemansia pectinata]